MISIMEEADWWTELHTAVINNDLDKIQRYEYFSSDLNPLDLAIMVGNLDAVKALITRGIQYDINACLRKAIFARRNELAEFFLENGASPYSKTKNGHTPFHVANLANNHIILRTLNEFHEKNNLDESPKKANRLSIFNKRVKENLGNDENLNNISDTTLEI